MTNKVTFEQVNLGDTLPEVTMHITQEDIWKHAVASLDYNPVHTHPEWCQTAQVFGLDVPVMHGNQTMSLMATALTNWAYPGGGFVKRMETKLIKPVPVGSTITCGATVTEKHTFGGDRNFVTLDIWAQNQDGEKVGVGEAEVILP